MPWIKLQQDTTMLAREKQPQYAYRRFDCFGDVFFRILEWRDGQWSVVAGTYDYARELEASRKVKELSGGVE